MAIWKTAAQPHEQVGCPPPGDSSCRRKAYRTEDEPMSTRAGLVQDLTLQRVILCQQG